MQNNEAEIALNLIRFLLTADLKHVPSIHELREPGTFLLRKIAEEIQIDPSELHTFLFLAGSSEDLKSIHQEPLIFGGTGEKYYITDHALARFVQRWRQVYPAACFLSPLEKVKQTFFKSKMSYLPARYSVSRVIANGFKKAEYFDSDGKLRFVAVRNPHSNEKVIVTVEIIS